MLPTLLYINTFQFGYHMGSYRMCQNLKEDFKVTYICFDNGYKKIEEDGVEVIYVPWNSTYIKNGIKFMRTCIKYIKTNRIDHIFAVYFPFVSFLKVLLGRKNMILDFRTGNVDVSRKKRLVINNLMRFDALFFNKISVVSESLALKLNFNRKKVFILPLGADVLSKKTKSFESLKLFYIGILDGRNIPNTLLGLKRFLDQNNLDISKVTYDIVGFGSKAEEDGLIKTIRDAELTEVVVFHGRKSHSQLQYYFDNCNIGVSYVPITEYYDCQPPTKTFEYINAGMVCIATETQENKKLINSKNGIVCRDNPESFCSALLEVTKNLTKWDSSIIRGTSSNYSWVNISENLKNYILDQDLINYGLEKNRL